MHKQERRLHVPEANIEATDKDSKAHSKNMELIAA